MRTYDMLFCVRKNDKTILTHEMLHTDDIEACEASMIRALSARDLEIFSFVSIELTEEAH